MRILITGGSGFIAGRLAFYLNKKGYDVTIGSRNDLNQFNLNSKVKVVKTNWNDKHSIAECCKNKDIIIHAAGMNSQLCEKYPNESINFKKSSTSLLINSLDPEFDKFIYISSAHVYANPLSGIISEDTKTKNIHPYAKSHLAAEKIVNEANNQKKINGLILRLSNCFGYPINVENDCWMLLVNDLCKQAITKKKLILNSGGEQQRDFISLHDFTRIT